MLLLQNTEELDDHVLAAITLKEQGNNLLSNGDYGLAALKYTDAIELHPTAILLSNRSQALIKLESFALAIEDATAALRLANNHHFSSRDGTFG